MAVVPCMLSLACCVPHSFLFMMRTTILRGRRHNLGGGKSSFRCEDAAWHRNVSSRPLQNRVSSSSDHQLHYEGVCTWGTPHAICPPYARLQYHLGRPPMRHYFFQIHTGCKADADSLLGQACASKAASQPGVKMAHHLSWR